MVRSKRINTKERRASRRVSASELIPQGVTKLATGQEVKLINISCSGSILIHGNTKLSPGSYVRLKLNIPGSLMNMEGRIQRCRVVGLKQGVLRYEAAIVLHGGLPQPLAEKLQILNEENLLQESAPLQEIYPSQMPMPETAELWILNPQEA